MHPKYRSDIDGLRAFAVLSVLVYHLNDSWLQGGFVGVDIFFVISGFLITKIIVSELSSDTFSFANFYARRVRRIFPALFYVLLFCTVMAYMVMPQADLLSFTTDLKFAGAQIANFRFAQTVDYSNLDLRPSPLLHTWSLGVEEQFYLLWPLLILLAMKLWGKGKPLFIFIPVIFLLSLGISEYLLSILASKQAYYMFYSRAFELAAGAFIALPITKPKNPITSQLLSILGVIMMIFSVLITHNKTPFPGLWGLLPTIGAALFIYAGAENQNTYFNRFLSQKIFVHIGKISYSLYLWHWPVIIFYFYIFDINQLSWVDALICLGTSYTASYFSYKYIEIKFRKKSSGNRRENLKILAISFVCMGLCAFLAQQIRLHKDGIGRGFNDSKLVTAFSTTNEYTDTCTQYPNKEHVTHVLPQCTLYGKTEYPDVLMLGDSHSGHYFPSLFQWVKENNLTYGHINYSASLLLRGDYKMMLLNVSQLQDTATLTKEIHQNLLESRHFPKYILMAQRYDDYVRTETERTKSLWLKDQKPQSTEHNVENLKKLYKDTAEWYVSHGAKVIIMGQTPTLNGLLSICYERRDALPLSPLLPDSSSEECFKKIKFQKDEGVDNFTRYLSDLAERTEGVYFFDPRPYIQTHHSMDGKILYHDDNHLTRVGSNSLQNSLYNFMEIITQKEEH